MRHRYGTTYDAFLNGVPGTPNKRGLMTMLNQLDQQRNEIVHWHVLRNVSDTADELILAPPAFWLEQREERKTTADFAEFCAKASFAGRILNMFNVYNSERSIMPSEEFRARWQATWRDIFQQPCVYPPPDSHPLSPNYKEPETPPQPSEA